MKKEDIILVVEDDHGMAEDIVSLLTKNFPTKKIRHEASFISASRFMEKHVKDICIVVLDNQFPHYDGEFAENDKGMEFLSHIRHDRFGNSKLPVVMFTGSSSLKERLVELDSSVEIIPKSDPFDLPRAIKEALGNEK